MSLPTLVKLDIVEAIRAKYAALPMVGAAAVFDVGPQAEDLADKIIQQRSAGKFALVLTVTADAIGGPDTERQQHHGVQEWEFAVATLVHMPEPPPLVNSAQPNGPRMRPDQAAAYIHAAMLTAIDDETLGGKALWVECLGGGGAAIDENLALVTDHALLIRYRHPTGNPGVAA